jgi:hypothetical protein
LVMFVNRDCRRFFDFCPTKLHFFTLLPTLEDALFAVK